MPHIIRRKHFQPLRKFKHRCISRKNNYPFLPRDESAVLLRQVVRPSVCLSVVTLRYLDHVGWKASKIISQLVSLGCSLFAERMQHYRSTPKGTPVVMSISHRVSILLAAQINNHTLNVIRQLCQTKYVCVLQFYFTSNLTE